MEVVPEWGQVGWKWDHVGSVDLLRDGGVEYGRVFGGRLVIPIGKVGEEIALG